MRKPVFSASFMVMVSFTRNFDKFLLSIPASFKHIFCDNFVAKDLIAVDKQRGTHVFAVYTACAGIIDGKMQGIAAQAAKKITLTPIPSINNDRYAA